MEKPSGIPSNPLDSKNTAFTFDDKKSCIGKRILIYHLKTPLEKDFFKLCSPQGELSFPLGEQYPFYQCVYPNQCVMTGLLSTTEIKVIPRIKASLLEVKDWAENQFNSYYKHKMEALKKELP